MPLLRRTTRPRGAHLPPRERLQALSADLEDDLRHGELVVLGAHPEASNLAVVVEVRREGRTRLAVYKPVRGERPLWDFPDGTLAGRERASYLVARAGGWTCVPTTVLRDGPLGEGAVQEWIGSAETTASSPVVLTRPELVPPGHVVVLSGEDEQGEPVAVSHPDEPLLRSISVLDVVLNNSDRKGGHLLSWRGAVHGIDHGVCLHEEDKLRTVLWGWAGELLLAEDVARLEALLAACDDGSLAELDRLLTPAEVGALRARVVRVLAGGRHPLPGSGWPAVPWPPL